jgi:hypothetical protein
MSSNLLNDISDIYINEVIQPQLGKSSPVGVKKVEKGKNDPESSAKRIRQAVYDIRYRARREDIKLDQAFNQYMAHTNMSGNERVAVKERLGLTEGAGSAPVKEEYMKEEGSEFKKYKVRVTDKQSGKTYVRFATRQKISQLRKNPNISSVEMTEYGQPYEGEKSKGRATADVASGKGLARKDYDGDGQVESGPKEYRGAVHNAIQRKKGLKPDGKDTSRIKESFSNWKEDLVEIMSNIESTRKVKEKNINNHKDKKIIINPEIKETFEGIGGQILEMQELDESFLIETVDIASDYFVNQGLNEEGLDNVIEELGLEKFNDFVFYIAEDYNLTEARTGGVKVEPVTKSGKSVGSLKGGAKSSAIARLRKEKAARKEAEAKSSSSKQSGMTAALKSQSSVAKKVTTDKGKKAVEKAKASQGTQKPLKDRIAKGVLGAINAYQKGMERHRAATATATKAAKVAGKAATVFGKGVVSGVKTAAHATQAAHKVLKNSYEFEEELHPTLQRMDKQSAERVKQMSSDAQKKKKKEAQSAQAFQAHKKTILSKGGTPVQALDTWKKMQMQKNSYEMEGENIQEKSVSVSQQQAAGAALAAKRGEIDPSELKGSSLEMYKSMSEKQLRDFAKTKHKGLPEKKEVKEAVKQISGRETTPPSGTTAQQDDIQKKQVANAQMQQAQNKPTPQQKKLALLQKAQLAAKMRQVQSGQPLVASYNLEGDVIDERTKARKGQPRPERDRAMEVLRTMPSAKGLMTKSGKTLAQHEAERGVSKRDRPKRPEQTTADRLALKKQREQAAKAAAQRASQNMYKPRAGESD